MWKFTKLGKEAVKIALMGDDDDRSNHHTHDEVFEKEIYGLTITQHIDMQQHHGVMLIEGMLWDSSGLGREEGTTAKEVADFGFNIFEKESYFNLFAFHPELMKPEYIENLNELPCLYDHSTKGIQIFSGDDA